MNTTNDESKKVIHTITADVVLNKTKDPHFILQKWPQGILLISVLANEFCKKKIYSHIFVVTMIYVYI